MSRAQRSSLRSDNGTRAQEAEADWGAPEVHQLLYALCTQPTLQLPQMALAQRGLSANPEGWVPKPFQRDDVPMKRVARR